MAVVAGGRRAVTHYRVLERFQHHCLLQVQLETGRTHQIRVHMAHIRHPLVGDALYGGRSPRGSKLSTALRDELQRFPRQALHACLLELAHPGDGRMLQFQSPLPEDLLRLLAALRGG
jgi:23S rRNA pseudouridine1911/1915/1917 synthase